MGRYSFDFSGQVALVSGGSSGIGRAIAEALRDAGARVIATHLPGETPSAGGIEFVALDAGDQAGVDALVSRIGSNPGRLDILVNCAGMIRRQAEYDMETFLRVLDVNLAGTMRLCTAARPLLACQGGSIVNTASMLSFFGGGLVPAYSASKGGVMQLTKSLAIAWAAENIRVNAVAPGWIASSGMDTYPDWMKPQIRAMRQHVPLQRLATEAEVSAAIVFLLSPAAAFITGVCLRVDGGVPNARRHVALPKHSKSQPFNGFHRAVMPKVLQEE